MGRLIEIDTEIAIFKKTETDTNLLDIPEIENYIENRKKTSKSRFFKYFSSHVYLH